jgi:hypothetical protein
MQGRSPGLRHYPTLCTFPRQDASVVFADFDPLTVAGQRWIHTIFPGHDRRSDHHPADGICNCWRSLMENSAACQAFSKYPRYGAHQAVIAQAVAQAICAILGDVNVLDRVVSKAACVSIQVSPARSASRGEEDARYRRRETAARQPPGRSVAGATLLCTVCACRPA